MHVPICLVGAGDLKSGSHSHYIENLHLVHGPQPSLYFWWHQRKGPHPDTSSICSFIDLSKFLQWAALGARQFTLKMAVYLSWCRNLLQSLSTRCRYASYSWLTEQTWAAGTWPQDTMFYLTFTTLWPNNWNNLRKHFGCMFLNQIWNITSCDLETKKRDSRRPRQDSA